MLESFLSRVPDTWAIAFIMTKLAEAGVTNHFGYDHDPDTHEWKIRVLTDDADTLLGIIDTYQVDYLAVLIPELKARIAAARATKVQHFTFGQLVLDLDHVTEARITGAALGLMRNESVEAVNWDIGNLTFVSIPRASMLALADAAFAYVQACFTRSKELGAALDAATTVDDARAIDLNAGWPT